MSNVVLCISMGLLLISVVQAHEDKAPEVSLRRNLQQSGSNANGDVRLVGSNAASGQGLVQVFYSGSWFPVCDDRWDTSGNQVASSQGALNAAVICRQLGYTGGSPIFGGSGNTNDVFRVDELACRGTESSILSCPRNAWESEDCSAREAIGVRCTGSPRAAGTLRLVNGGSSNQGTLEVWYSLNGSPRWGPVCDDSWHSDFSTTEVSATGRLNANAACRALGFAAGGEALLGNRFGNTNGDFGLDDVRCSSASAVGFGSCSKLPYGVENCIANEAVSLRCNSGPSEGSLRLVGGPNSREGLVEYFTRGVWYPVCDDGWTTAEGGSTFNSNGFNNANVICRQLGFSSGSPQLNTNNRYGTNTNSDFAVDNLVCASGTLRSISQCSFITLGAENCFSSEAIGVRCV